jgi:hypothetical protein
MLFLVKDLRWLVGVCLISIVIFLLLVVVV